MVTMLIISIILAVLYTGTAIWSKRSLPDSVSSMVYHFPATGKYLWTIWLWAITLLICPMLFKTIGENFGPIAHCFATSMMFTGAMPLVKGESNKAHNVLGISAGIFSQICVALIDINFLSMWMLWIFVMGSTYVQPQGWLGKSVKGKGIFVAEAICWLTVMGSLIFK